MQIDISPQPVIALIAGILILLKLSISSGLSFNILEKTSLKIEYFL